MGRKEQSQCNEMSNEPSGDLCRVWDLKPASRGEWRQNKAASKELLSSRNCMEGETATSTPVQRGESERGGERNKRKKVRESKKRMEERKRALVTALLGYL